MVKKLMLTLFMWLFCSGSAFALQVGDIAPDFTAHSTHGELVLSDSRKQGPVILAFYFADFTPL